MFFLARCRKGFVGCKVFSKGLKVHFGQSYLLPVGDTFIFEKV